MRFLFLAFLLVSFFLLYGALGLKTRADCEALTSRSEKIECYHIAAISSAYLGIYQSRTGDGSLELCNQILTYSNRFSEDSDFRKRAELESNNCYSDLARISGNAAYCNNIQQRTSASNTILLGHLTTDSVCRDLAEKTRQRNSGALLSTRNSLCSLVFIFPFLLFLSALIKRSGG